MVQIIEKKTEKVPGETSLFVTFDYKQEIIDLIKTFSGSNYNKKNKTWEIPLTYLSKLIDGICEYDSIDITTLKEKEKKEIDYSKISLREYKYKPFDYQEDGIKYGLTHDKWLLLYDMGLGKTAVISYLASELKNRGEIEHCLVICGVNSLKNNWKKEIKKFTDLSCVILGERVNRNGRAVVGGIKERVGHLQRKIDEFFVITNIETLREPSIIKAINDGPNKFDFIAVDEIHRCSSDPSTKQARGLLKLKKAKYKVGATGTLITNNPLNAYVPLTWLGVERGTYTNFRYYYCRYGGPFHNILVGYKNVEYLHDIIEKCSIRRTKDILGLPEKTVINEYVDMDDTQAKFYDNIRSGIKDQVDKVELNTTNMLAMVSRLRQATACPSFLTTEDIPSAKVDRAVDLAEQLIESGEKVVIFSTFKETVSILKNRLEKYSPIICTGDVPDDIVSSNIDIFQNDTNKRLFIATWQKCGTGITLTASRYMIFVDIPFTNSSYEQAQDRIHRIGTDNPVFIYHIITNDTIDERVLEIVESKEAISDYIVDGVISKNAMGMLRSFLQEM